MYPNLSNHSPAATPAIAEVATDPRRWVWVSASAGTGKTKLLIDRLLRILLSGTAPSAVVCITFTKAAAAEIEARLQKILIEWQALSDADLSAAISQIHGSVATVAALRPLLSQVLNQLAQLKIQTIHSFCQSFLMSMRFEGSLPLKVEVMDQRTHQRLLEEAINTVIAAIDVHTSPLVKVIKENHLRNLLTELIKKSCLPPTQAECMAAYQQHIQPLLLPEENTPVNPADLAHAVALLEQGTTADQAKAVTINAWLRGAQGNDNVNDSDYRQLFLTTELQIRKQLVSAALKRSHPELEAIMVQEAERLQRECFTTNSQLIWEISTHLGQLAIAARDQYNRRKQELGLLDYEDLINNTIALLSQDGVPAWALYKLYEKIDHLLLDEAQDTNYNQWRLIKLITSEFFYNPDTHKTLFVVGDFKQSIYGFQGAVPQLFEEMRGYFKQQAHDYRFPWSEVELQVSYRSTPAVLTMVDQVFADKATLLGLSSEHKIYHQANRASDSGQVEVWPLTAVAKTASPDGATAATDNFNWLDSTLEEEVAAPLLVAEQIAQRIAQWLNPAEPRRLRQLPLQPRDIMILLQRRGVLMQALINSLKRYRVPVTGPDRIILNEQLVVQDLLAIMRAVLCPYDDLSLIIVLKLAAVTELEILGLRLEVGPEGKIWPLVLERYPRVANYIHKLQARLHLRPYEFIYELLWGETFNPDCSLNHWWQDLGPEVYSVLEILLDTVIQWESGGVSTLQQLVQVLEAERGSIKVEGGTAANQVRVMSVHNAKGLQAPIVILADANQKVLFDHNVLWCPSGEYQLPLYNSSAAKLPALRTIYEQLYHYNATEYYRLLYVAMTRAEDELYITGWSPKPESSTGRGVMSWYELVETHVPIKEFENPDNVNCAHKAIY